MGIAFSKNWWSRFSGSSPLSVMVCESVRKEEDVTLLRSSWCQGGMKLNQGSPPKYAGIGS
uniref:Uncharacterized protein n=1 Tax=Oryza barthii TaxID=65489 RepID=A0A0D3GNL7_9ORYZ